MNSSKIAPPKAHLPWLDAMRFIAAFIVLICHTRNDFFVRYNELPDIQQNIVSFAFFFVGKLGYEAVIVFFVLSGFLVGGKGLERIHKHEFDVRSYAIDRIVRIGIPLVSAIVFGIIVMSIMNIDFSYFVAMGNLLSLQGIACEPFISPFWSLSYEVWFYIILGSIGMVFNGSKKGMVLFLICWLAFMKLAPYFLFMWFMGAFAYYLRPKKRNNVVLYLSFIMLLFFTCLSLSTVDSKAIHISFKMDRNIVDIFMAFSLCFFLQQIVLCVPKRNIFVCVERFFHPLANFSYTLYLTHRITLLLIFNSVFIKWSHNLDMKGIVLYILLLTTCMLTSWSIYYFTERKTSDVKRWIKGKLLK